MNQRVLIGLVVATLSFGCAARKPQTPAKASQLIATHSFVEFQPDWRIRVVVPILKSGGYNMKLQEMKSESGTVELKTSNDFLGYEIDHYAVLPRHEGGVTLRFQAAEIHMNNGEASNNSKPRLPLLQLPPDVRYVRLAFLTRLSATEHDAVILAAASRESMEALTARVEANPSQACKVSLQEVCSWIPEGVSVQPQKKQGRKWVPAV